jgi:hypothetical protein
MRIGAMRSSSSTRKPRGSWDGISIRGACGQAFIGMR